MSEPLLVPGNALHGKAIALSVSESADLTRLGLTNAHCELAVAELARAIFIAGGTIMYGGRLVERGFTDVLLDELRKYSGDRDALILCVPESEHRRLSDDDLVRREAELSTSVRLVCLDDHGEPIEVRNRRPQEVHATSAASLTAMREYVTSHVDARVVVGGKLTGYQGSAPGVVEEAVLSLTAMQPLYVAGGFGGAAAAVAVALGIGSEKWYPTNYPYGLDAASSALRSLKESLSEVGLAQDGLDPGQRLQLAATHRPGDISSLVVTGLGRLFA